MNPMTKTLTTAALTACLAATVALAQTPYDEGQKALREARWMDAAGHFEAAQQADEQVDAAMYWRAHALYKAGRRGDAARQLRELVRNYPDSPWTREAQALRLEFEGNGDDQPPVDDELRLVALSHLMERDPDRALPLVLDILHNTRSERLRHDAMFLLGMSDTPASRQSIAEFARDGSQPELQLQAINILGTDGSDASMALLRELYASATDSKVKRAIINAHITSGEPQPLVEMLAVEQDPKLQREMLLALGAMGETGSLDAVYPGLTDPRTRRTAIEAFAIAGDSERLRNIIAAETDPELRAAAITGIAIADDPDAPALLKSVYEQASDKQTRMAVLDALIILDDGGELALHIARTETDPDVRRQAIQALGAMGATGDLDELYAGIGDLETRKAVLEAMMVAEDADGLLRVVQTEQDPELRAQAIRMLAMADEDRAGETLAGLYPALSREEKLAVIEAMLIIEDSRNLIGLLEVEDDPELKREMLSMLSAMDSEEADEYLFQVLERDR